MILAGQKHPIAKSFKAPGANGIPVHGAGGIVSVQFNGLNALEESGLQLFLVQKIKEVSFLEIRKSIENNKFSRSPTKLAKVAEDNSS